MSDDAYDSACRLIRREAHHLLQQQPPRPVGAELWRILKLAGRHCGPEALRRVHAEALDLRPYGLSTAFRRRVLRIMMVARYGVEVGFDAAGDGD